MVWSLAIHHIDVGQGDSTLIVAEDNGVGPGHVAQSRVALVDAGPLTKGADVHSYITTTCNLAHVHAVIATHYDVDHFNGLRYVLNQNSAVYDTARIFDQGEPGRITVKRQRNNAYVSHIDGRDQNYTSWLDAIAHRGARNRITERVSCSGVDLLMTLGGWHAPDWLLGQELLWHGGVPPVGAPTVECIAVNQFVDLPGANRGPHQSGMTVDPKNENSLALLVTFNNFRYYLGGDLESTQEAALGGLLNPTNTANDRVLAMKVSHHGSDRSSTQAFVNRLRPSAAFISCGINNVHQHPRPAVLNNLQMSPTLQHYYMTEDGSNAAYNTRVGTPGTAPDLAGAYTAKAVVAGCWGPPHDAGPALTDGHIVLRVSHAQSTCAVTGPLMLGQSRFTVNCETADSALYQALAVTHL